jgi:hypothetical protein
MVHPSAAATYGAKLPPLCIILTENIICIAEPFTLSLTHDPSLSILCKISIQLM